MGHVSAISWVHQLPALHEEDLVQEYAKVEPCLRLNPSEVMTEARVRAITKDQEFKKMLREVLEKPDEWYDERVDRAVKGAIVARRRPVQVPRKSRVEVR